MLHERCYRKIGPFYDSAEWDIRLGFAWLHQPKVFKNVLSRPRSLSFSSLFRNHMRSSAFASPSIENHLSFDLFQQNLETVTVSKVTSSSLGENLRRFCCQSTYAPGRGNEVWKLLGHFVSAQSSYEGAYYEGVTARFSRQDGYNIWTRGVE